MFGFKKKKKTGGESNLSSTSNSPASSVVSLEKKPSKVSSLKLPFGRKSNKNKSETGSISSSDTQVSHGVTKQDLQNGTTNKPSNLPPGYIVLGKLASDLEALQVRKDSKEKAEEPVGVADKDVVKSYKLKATEDWGEEEVLAWLKDNDLAYFVELFDGCDIDGDYLLQVTEEDLVDLEVDDTELRKRLLLAVNDLINMQEEDDVDLSLPGLEDGESGSEWESVDEFDGYDKKAKNGHKTDQPKSGKARDHQITGSKLKNVDMSLLDQMKMYSSEDRERFLSSLYDATNPNNNPLLLSSIDEASEYEKQKYLAAVTVMQSPSPRVQLIPADPEETERAVHQDSMCSTGSESDSRGSWRRDGNGKKKKRGSFTKLRDALSGMSKNPSLVRVWTDIGAAKDKPVRLKLEIEESDKAKDLINLCLESLNMVEDPRLYCISEVCVADDKDHSTVTDREMDDNESPLKVRKNWRESLSGHFELRQRTAQGGVIKLVLKLPDEKPKGKLVAMSLSTPAHELIPLALMKYGLSDANAKDFCLLEVDGKGDLNDVDEETLLLQQESHAYVLCKKVSKDELMAITNESKAEAEQDPDKTDLSSLLESKTDSSSLLMSAQSFDTLAVTVGDEKLNQLEKEMASIEKSLQTRIGRSASWCINVKHNSDRKMGSPSRSQELADSKDEKLKLLEEENRKLKERLKGVDSMEEVFNKLKVTLRRLNTENNLKLLERRRAANPDLDSLPRDLAAPMFQLEGVTQEVEAKQAKIENLKRETPHPNMDTENDNYLVQLEEANLVALKLEQTRLLCTMEVAMADYQMSCAKRKELAESRSLITILPPNKEFVIVTAIVNAGAEGYQFELGNSGNRKGIYISKCGPEDTMRLGDRVIEINNHSTFVSSVAEGNTKLNSTSKVKLVLLREKEEEDAIDTLNAKNKALLLEITQLKLALDTARNESSSPNNDQNHQKEQRDLSSILENLDDDVPLWEAIKSHTKSEILQVFQEEVQEANRQKQYLDQLYTLMLERAPELLEEMEQDFEASEISGDEEFC
ncbi:hypothetical protein BSL78_21781 [Apostichopus japonicus]|uniref:PDZ domain-containing protein n=1 Tax=Stichopus japonicus TaxID=307972 RepID=A0A2G8K031_STIJA|nr:hypothetical protein BSL78_21781 [Apostichopus japonicus]